MEEEDGPYPEQDLAKCVTCSWHLGAEGGRCRYTSLLTAERGEVR